MDSNETRNLLREMLGGVGFALLKNHLRKVKLKIDTEKRLVCITKDGRTQEIKFDDIEQAINEQV